MQGAPDDYAPISGKNKEKFRSSPAVRVSESDRRFLFLMRSEPAYLTSFLLQSHNCMRYHGCRLSGLIAFSLSTSLGDFVGQQSAFRSSQGFRLSASEKGKSSTILLFERRTEEKEGYACSERGRRDCMPQHLTSDVLDNSLDIKSIFVLSRPNPVRNAGCG